jgi:hypothetical protein
MSGWVFGLGLGAAYLMKKKFDFQQSIDEKVEVYRSNVQEANPGPTTASIRALNATPDPHDRFQDINVTKLPADQAQRLADLPAQTKQEVAAYEQGAAPIEGVWLNSRGAL